MFDNGQAIGAHNINNYKKKTKHQSISHNNIRDKLPKLSYIFKFLDLSNLI